MKISGKIMERDGGKDVPNKGLLFKILCVLAAVGIGAMIIFSSMDGDDSHLGKEKKPQRPNRGQERPERTTEDPPSPIRGVSKKRPPKRPRRQTKAPSRKSIGLAVPQVIERQDDPSPSTPLPSGTSAVGTTLQGIDTRSTQTVRVLLPYGMFRRGNRLIPRESILTGRISLKGEKVFIIFEGVVFPDGKSFKIAAHALDPKDFTSGLRGKRHGNTDLKMAAAMGLSMMGTMGEVLAQKEALGGEYGRITVKSTLKDAALTGLSGVAKQESQRRLEGIGQEAQREYAAIPRGAAVVVTLLEAFQK